MIKIYSRNIDEVAVCHEFKSPQAFIDDWNSEDCSMGDNEILLVIWNERTVYSSLGRKTDGYDDTVRTADVIAWFSTEPKGGDGRILKAVVDLPHSEIKLPDGSRLVTTVCKEPAYPGVQINLQRPGEADLALCFAEFNTEKPDGMQLCICAYSHNLDEPAYYESYNAIGTPSPNN